MKRTAIRLGGYGDPAMLPEKVIGRLVKRYYRWLGYTHQWRKPWAQWARRYMMASVDGEAEAQEARAMGWRTFRISYRGEGAEGEVCCPFETHEVQCVDCGLCDGARENDRRKSIWVTAHGARSKRHMEV